LQSKEDDDVPLAQTRVQIDDRLGALDVSEAAAPCLEHLVTGLRQQASNVDVGLATLILQSTIERLERRGWSRNGTRDDWLLRDKHLDCWRDVTLLGLLGHGHAVGTHHGRRRWRAVREDTGWGAVDCHAAMSEGRIASVRRSSRLIVLVGGDRVAARCDQSGHFARGTSRWSPVLGQRAVVLLVVGVAHWWHVLSNMRSVEVGSRDAAVSSIVVWEDVPTRSTVHVRGHRGGRWETGEGGGSGTHHGILGLGSEGGVLQIHALETMSESGQISGGVVHAVGLSSVATRAILIGVHVGGRTVAVVLTIVGVVLGVGDSCHCCRPNVNTTQRSRGSHEGHVRTVRPLANHLALPTLGGLEGGEGVLVSCHRYHAIGWEGDDGAVMQWQAGCDLTETGCSCWISCRGCTRCVAFSNESASLVRIKNR
jgi:hypothetical protein